MSFRESWCLLSQDLRPRITSLPRPRGGHAFRLRLPARAAGRQKVPQWGGSSRPRILPLFPGFAARVIPHGTWPTACWTNDSAAASRNREPRLPGFVVAELGEAWEYQINELFGGEDGRPLKGLGEMFGVPGHKVIGSGGLGAF
jgi:hypothetical protein